MARRGRRNAIVGSGTQRPAVRDSRAEHQLVPRAHEYRNQGHHRANQDGRHGPAPPPPATRPSSRVQSDERETGGRNISSHYTDSFCVHCWDDSNAWLRLDADCFSLYSQVIEVRDARIPLSSACGHLETLIQVTLSHFSAFARDPFWLAWAFFPSRMLSRPPMLPKRAEISGTDSHPVCAGKAPHDRPKQERPYQPERSGDSPSCLASLARCNPAFRVCTTTPQFF